MNKLLKNNYVARTLLVLGFFGANYLSYKSTVLSAMQTVGMGTNIVSTIFTMFLTAAVMAVIFELIIRAGYGFLQNTTRRAILCDKETFAITLRKWQLLKLAILTVFNIIYMYIPLSINLLQTVGAMIVSLVCYTQFYLELEKNGYVDSIKRNRLVKTLGLVLIVYYAYVILIGFLI